LQHKYHPGDVSEFFERYQSPWDGQLLTIQSIFLGVFVLVENPKQKEQRNCIEDADQIIIQLNETRNVSANAGISDGAKSESCDQYPVRMQWESLAQILPKSRIEGGLI
jgi:hypothetical protein